MSEKCEWEWEWDKMWLTELKDGVCVPHPCDSVSVSNNESDNVREYEGEV